MMEMTLEEEFVERVLLHKCTILREFMKHYYDDLQNTGITIPEFLQEKTPDEQAQEYVADLILKNDNQKTFNEKYEMVWQEIAPFLD